MMKENSTVVKKHQKKVAKKDSEDENESIMGKYVE
jgi:hypothetical protein